MEKTLTDRNGKEIKKGTIVHYAEGWVRVKSLFVGPKTVNLCGIFNGLIYHKQVPVSEIYEDHAAWYANWQESETYKSM